jgi:CPA2 family monovalent cation:H+ antiporter-2
MNHGTPYLQEFVIVAGLALAISLLFRRLRAPAVTGFILTGVLIGPGGFGLVSDLEVVRALSEFGVVLLMFAVGLEFSLADLRAVGARSLATGVLQIVLTAALVTPIMLATGAHPARALFFALLLSLSSTALVFKLLTERGELQSPHGRLTAVVLLMQDVALVPIALLTPVLSSWAGGTLSFTIGRAEVLRAVIVTAVTAIALVVAWRTLPWLVQRASRTRSRETFLAAVVFVVAAAAYLGERAGLSVAIGAFLAGLMLAGSETSSQIAADVLPFRDTLSSVFFISIGMLFVPRDVMQTPGLVVAATLGLGGIKLLATTAAARLSGIAWPIAIASGFALAHVGEFSFVLARIGSEAGLLPEAWVQVFLAGALFSIVLVPWFIARGPGWGHAIDGRFHLSRAHTSPEEARRREVEAAGRSGHVVIAGFGLNGRNVARVLRAVRIPHLVLDQGPDKIAACEALGSDALLGNATQIEILHRAGMEHARAFVVALSDPIGTRHATRLARSLNRSLFIVVRTRYVHEMDGFYESGANLVIPEEFETSIEIFTAVLRQFHVPNNIIDAQIGLLRRERYSILRGRKLPGSVVDQLDRILAEGTTETVLILQHSPAVGRTLRDLSLDPSDSGLRIVAVVRGGNAVTALGPEFRIDAGDTLVLTGAHREIDAALDRLAPPEPVEMEIEP